MRQTLYARIALLAFVLAVLLPQANTPVQAAPLQESVYYTQSVADATTVQGGEMYYWNSGCDTVNCRSRHESGKTSWTNFSPGDTVIGWRVRPEDKYDARPHPCIWENASTWGRIYDGVVNPWTQELQDAYRNGWQRC